MHSDYNKGNFYCPLVVFSSDVDFELAHLLPFNKINADFNTGGIRKQLNRPSNLRSTPLQVKHSICM